MLIVCCVVCLQHKCYIVATCDKDLKRRIRKIPGVPIMYISQHRLVFYHYFFVVFGAYAIMFLRIGNSSAMFNVWHFVLMVCIFPV